MEKEVNEQQHNLSTFPAGAISRRTIISAGGNQTEGDVRIQQWTARGRLWRALKAIVICWGFAAACLAIPILHFILVPLFFIAGLIWPLLVYSKTSIVLGGSGSCPLCAAPFQVARASNKFPLDDICTSCHRHVTISTIE